MASQEPVPWSTCSDYILACGSQHEPYRFSLAVLEKIRDIVPYDQALFLMLDGNRKIARRHFIGFTDRWMSMYLNYYSRSTETDFSLDQEASEIDGKGYVSLIDWHELDWIRDDFIVNYIKPRRLSQSLSFTLFDLKGAPACIVSRYRGRYPDRIPPPSPACCSMINGSKRKRFPAQRAAARAALKSRAQQPVHLR